MGKYLYAYRGGQGMAATPEEQQKTMAAWGAWFGELGPAIVDGGAPFAQSTSVSKGAKRGDAASALGGYSVVTADSIEAAAKMAEGCPIVAEGGHVDVYDCIDIQM